MLHSEAALKPERDRASERNSISEFFTPITIEVRPVGLSIVADPADVESFRGESETSHCPNCNHLGHIDLVDLVGHTMHFTCETCGTMWQVRTPEDDAITLD